MTWWKVNVSKHVQELMNAKSGSLTKFNLITIQVNLSNERKNNFEKEVKRINDLVENKCWQVCARINQR